MPQDHARAAGYFQRAAALGDLTSILTLGEMHAKGLGVNRSAEAAFEMYEKAAGMGSIQGLNGEGGVGLCLRSQAPAAAHSVSGTHCDAAG